VYARKVKGRELTFQVSGKLWLHSLVMRDLETGTLWSHILGEAMEGPLKGTKLEVIPSVMTDWKSWKAKHPDTTVTTLRRSANRFVRSIYTRHASRFVLGLSIGEASRAWPLNRLQKKSLVHDTFGNIPLVVFFDVPTGTARAFDRRVAGKTLSFTRKGEHLIDDQTKTKWDRLTGKGLHGPLAGKQLQSLPAIISFKDPWKNFHPESTYYR